MAEIFSFEHLNCSGAVYRVILFLTAAQTAKQICLTLYFPIKNHIISISQVVKHPK